MPVTEETNFLNNEELKIGDTLKTEDIITSQPSKPATVDKDNEIIQPPNKNDEVLECISCLTLCCNFIEQCWLCFCPCFMGDGCTECLDGTCNACFACFEGCGECCTQC